MPDPKVRALAQANDIVGLFTYLGPMWLKICMENLEDLTTFLKIGFVPNPEGYEAEMRAAGISVVRMQVAMAAVLHKAGRSITYEQFTQTYADKLATLPLTQRIEVHDFWFAGPRPGLKGTSTAPVIGNTGDWFVTSLTGTTNSVVITVGFTAMTGNITFTRADGSKYSNAIGAMGPSLGASVIPGGAKVSSMLASRFPVLNQLLNPGSVSSLSNDLLKWLTSSPSLVAKTLWSSPLLMKYVPALVNALAALGKNSSSSSGLPDWTSQAIGTVIGNNGKTLEMADFAGACVMFSVSGSATVISGGLFVLAFGLPKAWNPFTDISLSKANGFALISAASASIQVPNLGVSETLFWGEIV